MGLETEKMRTMCCNNGITVLFITPTNYTHKECESLGINRMCCDIYISRCELCSRRLSWNMASTLIMKVLLQIANLELLI